MADAEGDSTYRAQAIKPAMNDGSADVSESEDDITETEGDVPLPEWLPELVGKIVRDLVRPDGRSDATLEDAKRIAADIRMKEVWGTLLERKRTPTSNGPFFHPANKRLLETVETARALYAEASEIPEPDRLQHVALGLLFYAAISFPLWAAAGRRIVTESEAQAEISEAKYMASLAQELAGYARRTAQTIISQRLETITGALEKRAVITCERYRANPLVVTRQSARTVSPEERGFIITLAQRTRNLFGESLYGITAIIANVALERTDLAREDIRAMIRPRGTKNRTPAP